MVLLIRREIFASSIVSDDSTSRVIALRIRVFDEIEHTAMELEDQVDSRFLRKNERARENHFDIINLCTFHITISKPIDDVKDEGEVRLLHYAALK